MDAAFRPEPGAVGDAPGGAAPDALAGWLHELATSFDDGRFARLVFARPTAAADADAADADADVQRIDAHPVALKGVPRIVWTEHRPTRDLHRNLAPAEALVEARARLAAPAFAHARLETHTATFELLTSRKGRRTLLRHALPTDLAAGPGGARSERPVEPHDRPKHRVVDSARPYLAELGILDRSGSPVPAMARKWRQIDKFVELLDGALDATGLKTKRAAPLRLADFGCGKGYLTFAAHDHLRHTLGLENAEVLGVELRGELVDFCNAAAARLGAAGLRFEQGDIASVMPPELDVMIALHACDTATDLAIAAGVAAGAAVIMCSPCCHKELRPQLLSPHPLRPILKHGVHLGQQAEMLTDGLRALLLDACGYDARVFEFVALEHTNKNKMILAQRRTKSDRQAERRRAEALLQVDEIKRFYGIREQCLERLLAARLAAPPAPA